MPLQLEVGPFCLVDVRRVLYGAEQMLLLLIWKILLIFGLERYCLFWLCKDYFSLVSVLTLRVFPQARVTHLSHAVPNQAVMTYVLHYCQVDQIPSPCVYISLTHVSVLKFREKSQFFGFHDTAMYQNVTTLMPELH